MPQQTGWRCCARCKGVFFALNAGTRGRCPAGGEHDDSGSLAYSIEHRSGALGAAPGEGLQPTWRWCSSCQGLFFGGNAATQAGQCPAGGAHRVGQGNYLLAQSDPTGVADAGFSWCSACMGLHRSSGPLGACPGGGTHRTEGSGAYVLSVEGGTARPPQRRQRPMSSAQTTATSGVATTITPGVVQTETSPATASGHGICPQDTTFHSHLATVLELEGRVLGAVQFVSGGEVRAEVISSQQSDGSWKKRLGAPRVADIHIQLGPHVLSDLLPKLRSALRGEDTLLNGRLLSVDSTYRAFSELPLRSARVEQLRFPGIDASSRDPARFGLTLRPTGPVPTALSAAASGPHLGTTLQAPPREGERLLVSNARLHLEGLDLTGTTRTSDLVIRRVADGSAALEVCDMTVTVLEHHARALLEWTSSFVLGGSNGAEHHKTGHLDYLYASGAQLLSVALGGVGVRGYTVTEPAPSSGLARSYTFELYIERAHL